MAFQESAVLARGCFVASLDVDGIGEFQGRPCSVAKMPREPMESEGLDAMATIIDCRAVCVR